MKPRITFWLIMLLILVSLYFVLPKVPANLTLSLPSFTIPTAQTKIMPDIKFPGFSYNLADLTGNFPIKLGLDLQGGTQLVLETDMSKIPEGEKDDALDAAREVIERRVNLFGVSEAKVQSSRIGNTRRILVELPGVKDASQAASLVGKTAQLEFREVATSSAVPSLEDIFNAQPTDLTGADLKKAQVVYNQSGTDTNPQVSIQFTPEGAKKFAELTRRNLGKPVPIFLDNEPITWPTVQQEILTGDAVISGGFTAEQAKQLAVQLNAGALPVPVKIVDQHTIGAELGQDSINKSIIAGVIGLLTVMVFMVVYYGGLGLVASLALIIYTLFVLAIFKTGLFIMPPVTLTLAGVAGFILSIGMAVDANILIFERMKEERRWGKSKTQALELGFKRAWSSIRDSNVSSLITAAILFSIGTGPVRGFAVALAIGVLVSMFTAITVTRTILKLLIKDKPSFAKSKNSSVSPKYSISTK